MLHSTQAGERKQRRRSDVPERSERRAGPERREGTQAVRWGLVRRAQRRLAAGAYDDPRVLGLAVERMMRAMESSPPARERETRERFGRTGGRGTAGPCRGGRERGGAWGRTG